MESYALDHNEGSPLLSLILLNFVVICLGLLSLFQNACVPQKLIIFLFKLIFIFWHNVLPWFLFFTLNKSLSCGLCFSKGMCVCVCAHTLLHEKGMGEGKESGEKRGEERCLCSLI